MNSDVKKLIEMDLNDAEKWFREGNFFGASCTLANVISGLEFLDLGGTTLHREIIEAENGVADEDEKYFNAHMKSARKALRLS